MKFLPYQNEWIYDKSRLKLLQKSRRIGGTYATSYGDFREIMEYKHHDVVAVTRDERLATEFILDVSQWGRMWNAIQPASMAIPDRCFKTLSFEIPHASGASRVLAVSSNPNAAIGKGGSLRLDEFAAHKDPELLLSLAQPIMLAGGSISILSTHRGRNSKFNQIILEALADPETEWSLHKTTIIDAIEQGLVEQIINPKMVKLGRDPWESRDAFLQWVKRTYDEHTFSQEFMCIPSEEASALLKTEELEAAVKKFEDEGHLTNGMYYVGYDIAESLEGDFAAVCVIRTDSNHEVEIIEARYFERGTPINEQIEDVVKTVKHFHARKLVPDQGGIGRHPCTILEERLGEHRVEPFVPTMQTKAEAYPKAKRYFQNGWVRMPKDDRVKDDFLSIDRIITESNNVVYQAVRSGNMGHGDMFAAFAMALTQVKEHTRGEIVGVSAKTPDPIDGILRSDDVMERDRLEDEINRRKSKNSGAY
jgi:phage FluMu gp28-like protein